MAYEVSDLLEGIKQGIRDLRHQVIRLENPEEVPMPEYLTTSTIAFSLAHVGRAYQPSTFSVRCEELTRKVWNGSLFSWLVRSSRAAQRNPLRRNHIRNRQRDSKKRPGKIDITLLKEDGFAFAIVETKGELTFTKSGKLYAGSAGEIEKDLVRNAEYLRDTGRRQGVQYSAFTFYTKDPSSVIEADAPAFISKMQAFFERQIKDMRLHHSIKSHVHIATFDKFLYADRAAALEATEQGAPSYVMDPAWHTVYGVISFCLVGDNITDHNALLGHSF